MYIYIYICIRTSRLHNIKTKCLKSIVVSLVRGKTPYYIHACMCTYTWAKTTTIRARQTDSLDTLRQMGKRTKIVSNTIFAYNKLIRVSCLFFLKPKKKKKNNETFIFIPMTILSTE